MPTAVRRCSRAFRCQLSLVVIDTALAHERCARVRPPSGRCTLVIMSTCVSPAPCIIIDRTKAVPSMHFGLFSLGRGQKGSS